MNFEWWSRILVDYKRGAFPRSIAKLNQIQLKLSTFILSETKFINISKQSGNLWNWSTYGKRHLQIILFFFLNSSLFFRKSTNYFHKSMNCFYLPRSCRLNPCLAIALAMWNKTYPSKASSEYIRLSLAQAFMGKQNPVSTTYSYTLNRPSRMEHCRVGNFAVRKKTFSDYQSLITWFWTIHRMHIDWFLMKSGTDRLNYLDVLSIWRHCVGRILANQLLSWPNPPRGSM